MIDQLAALVRKDIADYRLKHPDKCCGDCINYSMEHRKCDPHSNQMCSICLITPIDGCSNAMRLYHPKASGFMTVFKAGVACDKFEQRPLPKVDACAIACEDDPQQLVVEGAKEEDIRRLMV